MTTLVELDALVARVRRTNPGATLNLSARTPEDIRRLTKLATEGEARQAAEAAQRPTIEAGTQLHRTWERVLTAARTIESSQEVLRKDRAVHAANNAPAAFFEPVPELRKPECSATVADYTAANEALGILANELESRAQKIKSYVNGWEGSGADQQNRALILKLADRIEALERGSA